MKSRTVRILFKKELMDVFRDRKAILMLVLVPLLLYPLIFFGAFAVMSMVQSSLEQGEYKVVLDCDDNDALQNQIEDYNSEHAKESSDKDSASSENDRQIVLVSKSEYSDVNAALQNEDIDLFVYTEESDGKLTYKIKYVSSITDSNYAEGIVWDILSDLKTVQIKENITEAGLDAEDILKPFTVKDDNIASREQTTGSLLGMILPFMLIVSLLMGTMYPAIDTTAGEKERGTLETMLTLPVRSHEVIVAKFLTVALLGIISALLNMVSMGLMVVYLINVLSSKMMGSMGLNLDSLNLSQFIPALLVTILAIFAFSLFISAVTMCITAFAKSYKEANNYITPLTLVVMLTGYIGFIPNIELKGTMALLPVANICLLIKNLLLFKIDMGAIAMVLLTNVLYAILAILFLGTIYDSESILFDEGRFDLQLFQRRKNMKKGGVPTVGDAWFIICFVFIVYLYVGSILQMNFDLLGVFLSQMIVLILPLAYVIYTKKSIRETYSFKKVSPLGLLGSIMLFIGAFLVENVVSNIIYIFFPEDFNYVNESLTDLLGGHNIWIAILVVAVTPAICEEMMFRGFILSGFRSKYRLYTSLFLSSLVFGIYHTSMIRLLPTMILGFGLAMLVRYTGSIFPGMLMHCLNNLLSVLLMYYPSKMMALFPTILSEETTPAGMVITTLLSIAFIMAGVMTLHRLKAYEKN